MTTNRKPNGHGVDEMIAQAQRATDRRAAGDMMVTLAAQMAELSRNNAIPLLMAFMHPSGTTFDIQGGLNDVIVLDRLQRYQMDRYINGMLESIKEAGGVSEGMDVEDTEHPPITS